MKRKGNHVHYERALENYFRSKGILCIAVNEAKRPVYGKTKLKNFDFLVLSNKKNLLVDVKGKKFPYVNSNKTLRFWENWVSDGDIKYMLKWKSHISLTKVTSIFCFAYWLNHASALGEIKKLKNFKGLDKRNYHFKFGKREYAFLAIKVEVYNVLKKHRSRKLKSFYISRNIFKQKVYPISKYL